MNNLDVIWNRVRTPDPTKVKEFNRGGGFKGTASNTQATIQKATEVLGVCGIGWGAEIIEEKYVEGHLDSHTDDKGNRIENRHIIHVLQGRVWFLDDDGEKCYTPPQFGQTTFVGKNKYGFFTDEEAPKKSMTDMLLKCLAFLGFNADIFLGLFDDNKYVAEVRQKHIQEQKQKPMDWNNFKATLSKIDSMAALIAFWDSPEVKSRIESLNKADQGQANKLRSEREQALKVGQ